MPCSDHPAILVQISPSPLPFITSVCDYNHDSLCYKIQFSSYIIPDMLSPLSLTILLEMGKSGAPHFFRDETTEHSLGDQHTVLGKLGHNQE